MRAGALCPLREKSGNLEVLLTRRAFWNPKKKKLMTFPGEWVFPGGKQEYSDKTLANTAVREFKEEVGYKGEIGQVVFLRSGQTIADQINFYATRINPQIIKDHNPEVIESKWKTPQGWLNMICSEEFTTQQLKELKDYGRPLRDLPLQTIETLNYLRLLQDSFRFLKYLKSIYGGN